MIDIMEISSCECCYFVPGALLGGNRNEVSIVERGHNCASKCDTRIRESYILLELVGYNSQYEL